jgi:hypothetical protein
MKLLKNKIWSWCDVAFLKWSAFLFGMIAGAYFSAFIKEYLLLFLLVAIVLAIRPSIAYFRDE